MTEIRVDLNTRIIPEGHEVYIVRPGKGCALYEYFVEEQAVLAELPGLDLTRGRELSVHADLDARIKRARAIRSWYRKKRQGKEPSRDLSEYPVGQNDLSVVQLRAVLSGLFERLKRGDLVLVPPSAYSYPAYLGEVTGGPTDYLHVRCTRYYGNDALPGRRVKWLAQIEKRRLPDEILSPLEKPTSIFLAARSVRPVLYDLAYGSYVDLSIQKKDFSARFFVSSDKFTTSSDILLQGFFNYIASNAKALETGDQPKGFFDAAFEDLGSFAPELKTNVNSPGFLSLLSKDKSTPLVAAVMLALAIQAGPAAVKAAQEGRLLIGNSKAPPDDPCTALIAEKTLTQMRLLRLVDEWPTACEKARLAAEKTGVTSSIKIEQKP